MSGIIETYKRVFANKKANLWLFIVYTVLYFCSIAFNIAIGKPDSINQNWIDIIASIFLGIYAMQFLHNVMHNINNGFFPNFKDVQWLYIGIKIIIFNFIWGLYIALVIALGLVLYVLTHSLIMPITLFILTFFVVINIYYLDLALCDDFEINNLLKITTIFKCIKPGFKTLYLNLFLFILISIGILIIYAITYLLLSYVIPEITITKNFSLIDALTIPIPMYVMTITWSFVFPCTLIDTYVQKIRPIIGKELPQDGTNE